MALTEAEELELLELEAEAAAVSPRKKKKKSRARQIQAGVRGVTTGLLGAGDLAAAAGDVVGSQVIRPALGKKRLPLDETFKRVRGDREQLEQDFPLESGVGIAAGALAPIAKASQLLKSLGLGVKTAQPIANTARVAAGGGAAGVVTEANLGGDAEDIAKAGAVSAVGSPLAGAVIRAGGKTVGAARSIVDKNSNAGFRALARALSKEGKRVSPEQLQKRADELRATRGRPATVAEIVGERGGQDIAEAVQSGTRAQETLLTAAEKRASELQDNLGSAIERGRVTTGKPRLLERRGASMDAFMRKFGDRPVELDTGDLEVLLDPDASRVLPRKVKQALFDLEDEGGGTLTLRQMEDIRGAFRDAGKGKGENVRVFNELKKAVEDVTSSQVPEFGAAIGEFARRSATAQGVGVGQKIRSAGTREFEQLAERANPAQAAGLRVGARTALANEARKGPSQAASLVDSLAEDAGFARRLSAVDADEASRLQILGKNEKEALRSVAGTVRGTKIKSAAQEDVDNAKTFIETLVLSSGRASGGFQANFASKLVQRFKVPPTAAQKLAKAVTDPERTDEVIRILNNVGVTPTQVQEIAQAASRAAGRTAGPGSAEN